MARQRSKSTDSAESRPALSQADAVDSARWLPLLLGAVLAALTLAVYANALSGVFVFDDVRQILESTWLRDAEALKRLIVNGNARPLMFVTLAINYQMGQEAPFGYKLVNVLLHISAALALYGVVRRTLLLPRFEDCFCDSAAWLGFAVAALWAVHPLTTEAVSYVIHRSESLVALFALLLMYCTLRGSQASNGMPWCLAGLLFAWMGFASREVMVVVPAVLLLYDRIMIGGTWQQCLSNRGWLYLLLIPPMCLAFYNSSREIWTRFDLKAPTAATANSSGSNQQPAAAPSKASPPAKPVKPEPDNEFKRGTPARATSWQYLLTQPGVIVHYLRLSVWPYPQCADYMWPMARNADEIVPPTLLIMALLLATLWALWRYPAVGFLGAAFFLLLAPESSFISIEDKAAERRMYLPLAALAALLVLGIWKLLNVCLEGTQDAARRRERIGLGLLVPVLAILSFLTILRNDVYSSDVRFCEAIVQCSPHNSRAYVNLVRALLNDKSRDPKDALAYLLKAEQDAPQSAYVQSQIGHIRAQQGDLKEAEKRFRRAIELAEDPLFHLNLAVVLEQQADRPNGDPRDKDEACEHYQKAVDLSKGKDVVMPQALDGLGRTRAAKQQYPAAIAAYEEALRIDPDYFTAASNLVNALAITGEIDRALKLAENYLPRVETAQARAERAGAESDAAHLARTAQGLRAQLEGLRELKTPVGPQGK